MGILDILQGNPGAASPYGALYQQPGADPQQLAALYAAAGMVPPQNVDPFGDPSKAASNLSAIPAPATPAPSSPFGGGAAPFSFGGPGSMAGINPAMMTAAAPTPQPAPQPAPQAPPTVAAAPAAAPDPAAGPLAVGGYQMPRIGSADSFEPDDEEPANAKPTQGALPTEPTAPPTAPFSLGGASPGIGDRLGASVQSFANTDKGGLLGKLANGVSSLVTGQRTDPTGVTLQLQGQADNATAKALLSKNVDPQTVQAALAASRAGQPDMLKTLIAQNFGPDKFQHVTQTDAFGNQTIGAFDPTTGKTKFDNGDGTAASGGSMLAPGVKGLDSTLTGEDYLKQFSPEVQAAVHNYADGKSTPTGNPRKGFTQVVKMVAQKYGADTGQSIDDTTYSARRTMRNQLSSSAPSSLGGQINIGNTAAGHLADLTQKAVELGNVDTGIAPLTAAVNGVRGLGTEQAAKMEALRGAAQHYGQEITKFYAGSPGGTAERDRFIESVNGARSPKELAAILETEGELMHSRLDALGGQISGVLGPEGAKEYPVLRPDGQAGLAKVQENVAKLRGGTAAPAIGPLSPGQSTVVNGITIKRVN